MNDLHARLSQQHHGLRTFQIFQQKHGQFDRAFGDHRNVTPEAEPRLDEMRKSPARADVLLSTHRAIRSPNSREVAGNAVPQ
jgi:hypothetical protein